MSESNADVIEQAEVKVLRPKRKCPEGKNASTMSASGDDITLPAAEKVYGGCDGPDSEYVKIISSDGHEFIVKREHALISETIKNMLNGTVQFVENDTHEVTFREIPSHILQKVCAYFVYNACYYADGNNTEIPDFPLETEISLELLMAVNFLKC